MSSEARIAAARANGAKSRGPVTQAGKLASAANSARSTGPVTPEGKARSARNSTRHEALASSVVLDSESREAFLQLLEETWQELKPETGLECDLVNVAVVNHWRRMRLWCLESAWIAHTTRLRESAADPQAIAENAEMPSLFTAHAVTDLSDNSRVLDMLRRSEIAASREYMRALSVIQSLRANADRVSRS
jgi:hypothetical protein